MVLRPERAVDYAHVNTIIDRLINKLMVGLGPKYFYVVVSGQQKRVLQAPCLIAW